MDAIDILGLDIKVEDWQFDDQLPLYILHTFTVKKANINDVDCIMLIPHNELPVLPNLKKQIEKIKQIENLPVFLKLNHITRFKKYHLLRDRIAFVLNEQLVYLPFMGTVLTDHVSTNTKPHERFIISAQVLFIWILYQRKERYFIADAIHDLPFSSMAMTRAYRQLVHLGFFTEHKEGRKIYLKTNYTKEELFDQAKSYFVSPIIKVGYIEQKECNTEMVESSTLALSKYTMMNPSLPSTYAIDKKNRYLIMMKDELIDPENQVQIEVWEYDPCAFSKEQRRIDLISLFTSLLNHEDERVESAIEEIERYIRREILC